MSEETKEHIARRYSDLVKLTAEQERIASRAKTDLENMRLQMERLRKTLGETVGPNLCRRIIKVPSGIEVLVEYLSANSSAVHVFDPDGKEIL